MEGTIYSFLKDGTGQRGGEEEGTEGKRRMGECGEKCGFKIQAN